MQHSFREEQFLKYLVNYLLYCLLWTSTIEISRLWWRDTLVRVIRDGLRQIQCTFTSKSRFEAF